MFMDIWWNVIILTIYFEWCCLPWKCWRQSEHLAMLMYKNFGNQQPIQCPQMIAWILSRLGNEQFCYLDTTVQFYYCLPVNQSGAQALQAHVIEMDANFPSNCSLVCVITINGKFTHLTLEQISFLHMQVCLLMKQYVSIGLIHLKKLMLFLVQWLNCTVQLPSLL